MLKKIIIGVVVLAVLLLAGWKLFFSSSDVSQSLNDIEKNLVAYHMEATMDLENGEDTKSYFVTTDYQKGETKEKFRVSLFDKNINQEQIILRNEEGIFVLTPLLNQVYQFKGDWPLNSPKPYLYHSMLDALRGNHEVKKMDDGYLLSFKPEYKNAPNWVKEDVKFTKDLRPLWINIYNPENEIVGKINFTKVDFAPTFSDDYFDVRANMEKARENATSPTWATNDDLPLYPAGADVAAVLKEETTATVNGSYVHILTYEGTKPFTIIQSIVTPNESMVISEKNGEFLELVCGIAYYSNQNLTYIFNGVCYNIYSTSLSVAEMIEVANGMEVVAMK